MTPTQQIWLPVRTEQDAQYKLAFWKFNRLKNVKFIVTFVMYFNEWIKTLSLLLLFIISRPISPWETGVVIQTPKRGSGEWKQTL